MIELPTAIVSTTSVSAPDANQSFLRNGCADSPPTGSATAPKDMHQISSHSSSRDEEGELSDKKRSTGRISGAPFHFRFKKFTPGSCSHTRTCSSHSDS